MAGSFWDDVMTEDGAFEPRQPQSKDEMAGKLEDLMRQRNAAKAAIESIDKQILEAILPATRAELARRGTVWLGMMIDFAKSLPAPRHVVERAFEQLVDEATAERGFDGMNDTFILRSPTKV